MKNKKYLRLGMLLLAYIPAFIYSVITIFYLFLPHSGSHGELMIPLIALLLLVIVGYSISSTSYKMNIAAILIIIMLSLFLVFENSIILPYHFSIALLVICFGLVLLINRLSLK